MYDTSLDFSSEPNKSIELDSKRLQKFVDLLSELKTRRVRIPIVDIWKIFNEAFPHRPRGAEVRSWLLASLREAANHNIIKLPVEHGKRWDRSLQPPIPTSVDRTITPPSPPNNEWRRFPWHSRLSWVADLKGITPEQENFLRQVHKGLVQGSFDELAPLMYRSLELTGHEKRLKALTKTVLFEEGRLSLDLLGCIPRIPPLVTETICDLPIAIVFENVESFQVARNVLTKMSNPPYGIVAFGGGRSFQQSMLNFGAMNRSIERIEYVGDLDRAGLSIAMAATKIAFTRGLPPVIAARGIHRAMLQSARNFDRPLGWHNQTQDSDKADEDLITWLPADVRQEVLNILRAGGRVPEEILSSDEIQKLWQLTSHEQILLNNSITNTKRNQFVPGIQVDILI
jgi:hypothetical protein